jgi:hypothetical protein
MGLAAIIAAAPIIDTIGSTKPENYPYQKLSFFEKPSLRSGIETAMPLGKFCMLTPITNPHRSG